LPAHHLGTHMPPHHLWAALTCLPATQRLLQFCLPWVLGHACRHSAPACVATPAEVTCSKDLTAPLPGTWEAFLPPPDHGCLHWVSTMRDSLPCRLEVPLPCYSTACHSATAPAPACCVTAWTGLLHRCLPACLPAAACRRPVRGVAASAGCRHRCTACACTCTCQSRYCRACCLHTARVRALTTAAACRGPPAAPGVGCRVCRAACLLPAATSPPAEYWDVSYTAPARLGACLRSPQLFNMPPRGPCLAQPAPCLVLPDTAPAILNLTATIPGHLKAAAGLLAPQVHPRCRA